jgi:putative iron-regulated protein
MTMNKTTISLILSFALFATIGCKKDPAEPSTPTTPSTSAEILTGFSNSVAQATYNHLDAETDLLYQSIASFQSNISDANLITCKQAWRNSRSAWEQSEGFLFGPVSTDNIDPRIDTWPVDFARLDSVLNSSGIFTAGYVDSLEDALKGFHPIEYLLFGLNGNKTASQFTNREIEYLIALSQNLQILTASLADNWNPAIAGNYHNVFTTAGNGSSVYSTQRAAFEEMVNAMAGICDEVANGKMAEPFTLQDPSLEESPFSFNSITDFTNNIRSVENVYLGKYSSDGKGIEDLVRQHNLSLDGAVKSKISYAIAALQNITVPFGQAISQQPTQVQNAIDAINILQTEIEDNLLPFVQANTN